MELWPNFVFRKFGHDTFAIAEFDKRATVVGLSLTTLGDGGRDKVLSTVDRRLSPVDNTQHPASSRLQLDGRLDVTRHAGLSASAENCFPFISHLAND